MGYIGPSPNPGQNREVDDISSGFNGGTASFTLQVNGQNVSPGSANAIVVSLGGVIQNPGTDYTIAASTITFTTNPASGLSFFGLVLGQGIDTQTIADGQSPTMAAPSITGDLSIADKIVHTGDTNTAIRFPAADTITTETAGSERVRIASGGAVGIGNADPTQAQAVVQSASGTQLALIKDNTGASLSLGGVTQPRILLEAGSGSNILRFYPASGSSYGSAGYTERLRMFNNAASVYIGRVDGEVSVGSSNTDFSQGVGVTLAGGGNQCYNIFTANNTTTMYIGRQTSDGTLVSFQQAGSTEGSIAVSGSAVSFNGGHLSRWSQIKGLSTTDKSARPTIYQGTVMSNLDELCSWSHPDVLYTEEDKKNEDIPDGKNVGDIKIAAYTEDNQQLNMTKVSDTVGDKNVAGVFWAWDDDDDEYVNDFFIAMTGDMVIRVAGSTTVARGDLLISAGDGTAKPQTDDIVRSSTIAKIISTNHTATYADGSKAYPCVLMAC